MPLYGIAVDGVPLAYDIRADLPPVLFAPLSRFRSCGEIRLVYSGKTVGKSLLYSSETVAEKEKEDNGFWQRFFVWFGRIFQ